MKIENYDWSRKQIYSDSLEYLLCSLLLNCLQLTYWWKISNTINYTSKQFSFLQKPYLQPVVVEDSLLPEDFYYNKLRYSEHLEFSRFSLCYNKLAKSLSSLVSNGMKLWMRIPSAARNAVYLYISPLISSSLHTYICVLIHSMQTHF